MDSVSQEPSRALAVLQGASQVRSRVAAALAGGRCGQVRLSPHDLALYSTDASLYQVPPLSVVIPGSVEEGLEALRLCREAGLPVLPRGGGTALAGQTVNEAVVIDFSANCRGIVSIDAARRRAVVEPGVVLDQFNTALAPHGLMFGPDVATSTHATLGGMIGNNSAGMYSILFGRTVEHVAAIEAALGDGRVMKCESGSCERDPSQRQIAGRLRQIVWPLREEIRRRYPRILRHVDGYNLDLLLDQFEASAEGKFDQVNLATLLCGSEGTLATTLRAEVALVERPAQRGLLLAGFGSVAEALAALKGILQTKPAAVELVDDVVLSVAVRNTSIAPFVELMPKPRQGALGAVLYIEHFGASEAEVQDALQRTESALGDAALRRVTSPAEMTAAWRLRKAGEPLLHAVPGLRKPLTFVEDAAVDPSRLAEFVEDFRRIVARQGTTAAYYAHASVGCLHIRPMLCLEEPPERERLQAIAVEVADLVVRYGGALSGEHGDGRVRSPLLSRVLGPQVCAAMRQVKEVFDPDGRMNPGNLMQTDDPARILTNLRLDQSPGRPAAAATNTFFHYEAEEGFVHAVEQCNGAGICRRRTPGLTMCPSYRALLDERHSTRGRGNALRVAIEGGINPDWNDKDTMETLDLCLSCKACRAECPSNVDIAKLKAEYLAQGHAARGRLDWHSWLISRTRTIMRLASWGWPVSSFLAEWRPSAAIGKAILGITSQRRLPPVGRDLRRWWNRRRRSTQSNQSSPSVVLFADCFSAFSEPQIGQAAVELLEAAGYRVELASVGCCGRTGISVGDLSRVARVISRTAAELRRVTEACGASAILMLEPSCASAMRDEWTQLRLGAGEPDARWCAGRVQLVEEFLHRNWNSHPRPLRAASGLSERVLVHEHCHQKAIWGAQISTGLLRRLYPDVELVSAGCCGMAGSFGYAPNRFDLSMTIAQQELLPALRRAGEAVICASGTSCRQQVHHALGIVPLHPVQAALRGLADEPLR